MQLSYKRRFSKDFFSEDRDSKSIVRGLIENNFIGPQKKDAALSIVSSYIEDNGLSPNEIQEFRKDITSFHFQNIVTLWKVILT